MWSTELDSDGTENEFELSKTRGKIIEIYSLKLLRNNQQKKRAKAQRIGSFSVFLSYFRALFLSLKKTFVQSDEYFCTA